MNKQDALIEVKRLVRANRFVLVKRRSPKSMAVTTALAKLIVSKLAITDFVKHEADRDCLDEYVWIFKTEFGVKFISFHVSN